MVWVVKHFNLNKKTNVSFYWSWILAFQHWEHAHRWLTFHAPARFTCWWTCLFSVGKYEPTVAQLILTLIPTDGKTEGKLEPHKAWTVFSSSNKQVIDVVKKKK